MMNGAKASQTPKKHSLPLENDEWLKGLEKQGLVMSFQNDPLFCSLSDKVYRPEGHYDLFGAFRLLLPSHFALFLIYHHHQASTMSEHSTVHRGNGKYSSQEKRKEGFARQWGLPCLVLLIGTYAFVTKTSSSKQQTSYKATSALWESEPRALAQPRRMLATPYNTSAILALPAWTSNIADVWEPIESTHQPFFWYIPKVCVGVTKG
jgi:hypothetical protein